MSDDQTCRGIIPLLQSLWLYHTMVEQCLNQYKSRDDAIPKGYTSSSQNMSVCQLLSRHLRRPLEDHFIPLSGLLRIATYICNFNPPRMAFRIETGILIFKISSGLKYLKTFCLVFDLVVHAF